jgi:hypothetical protein
MNVAKIAAAPTLRRIGSRFPNYCAGEPAEGEDGDKHRYFGGHRAADGEADDQNDKQHINRKRYNPNSKIQELPPAFWPKALVDRTTVREHSLSDGGHLSGCVRLHANLPLPLRDLPLSFFWK